MQSKRGCGHGSGMFSGSWLLGKVISRQALAGKEFEHHSLLQIQVFQGQLISFFSLSSSSLKRWPSSCGHLISKQNNKQVSNVEWPGSYDWQPRVIHGYLGIKLNPCPGNIFFCPDKVICFMMSTAYFQILTIEEDTMNFESGSILFAI